MILILPIYTFAETGDILFEDDFTTKSKVDMSKTNAIVDTKLGEVRLPSATGSQSFDVLDDLMIIQNGNQIEIHERAEDGFFRKTSSYSDGDAIAMSFNDNGFAHYILKSDGSIYKMEYSEGIFIKNPVVALSGFSTATTISASQDKLLVGELNKLYEFIETDNGIVKTNEMLFDNVIDHVSLTTNSELIVSTDGNIHIFRQDHIGYVESPAEKLFGLVMGEMNEENDLSAADPTLNKVITYREDGVVLNLNHTDITSIKTQKGSLYVRDTNSITEYVYDGLEWIKAQTISGLEKVEPTYFSPRIYQSVSFSFGNPVKRFGINVSTDIPSPSQIKFEISPDGINFYPVVEGFGEVPTATTRLLIRATLSNEGDKKITPKIFNIQIVDNSLSIEKLETTRIVRDPGGNPTLPTESPVGVTAGYEFEIRVTAPGASKVQGDFSNGDSVILSQQSPGVFIGTHYFLFDTAVGQSFDVDIIAKDDGGNEVNRLYPNHFYITNNIRKNIRVYDTK